MMLNVTFSHLKGMSRRAEERLWSHGIVDWNDFDRSHISCFSENKINFLKEQLQESRQKLDAQDMQYFLQRLPVEDRTRICPHMVGKTAYVDIETTGLNKDRDAITTIALCDETNCHVYVRNINLHDFVKDLGRYQCLVTYNGIRFDMPFLCQTFQTSFPQTHLDLCPVLRAWGYRGGLKRCEELMGVQRQVREDMDGQEAVVLWTRYRDYNDVNALRRLLLYNCQDVLGLHILQWEAYRKSMENCPASFPLPKGEQLDLSDVNLSRVL